MTTADHRVLIFDYNEALAGAVTGEDWAREPSNLLIPNLRQDTARWTGEGGAAFEVELPKRRQLQALAIAGHTLPPDGLVRITWAADAESFDTPLLPPVWRPIYGRVYATADLSWHDENWWTGRPRARDLLGYTQTLVELLDAPVAAGAVRVELDAKGSAFDLGYLFVARPWRPEWGMAWGRVLSPVWATQSDQTAGGDRLFDRRRAKRRMQISLPDLTRDEAMRVLDLAMRLDLDQPLLIVPDPAGDPKHQHRQTFLARLVEGSAEIVEEDETETYSTTLTVEEV